LLRIFREILYYLKTGILHSNFSHVKIQHLIKAGVATEGKTTSPGQRCPVPHRSPMSFPSSGQTEPLSVDAGLSMGWKRSPESQFG